MSLFFGKHWGVPALDGAVQVATPVGEKCLRCGEAVADGDRGWLAPVASVPPASPGVEVLHAECLILGIVGHDNGVCRCTGFDTTTREAARELWRRVMGEGA